MNQRERRRGPKRMVMLLIVLGLAGVVAYLVRARRSTESAPGEWRVHSQSAPSAREMRVREAGRSTA